MIGASMAFNVTIRQLASGIMLMMIKPFKVGDLVVIAGNKGTVEAINAFNTTLLTLNNNRIFVSNSNAASNDIVNISDQGTIGVILSYSIGYGMDIDLALTTILDVG